MPMSMPRDFVCPLLEDDQKLSSDMGVNDYCKLVKDRKFSAMFSMVEHYAKEHGMTNEKAFELFGVPRNSTDLNRTIYTALKESFKAKDESVKYEENDVKAAIAALANRTDEIGDLATEAMNAYDLYKQAMHNIMPYAFELCKESDKDVSLDFGLKPSK